MTDVDIGNLFGVATCAGIFGSLLALWLIAKSTARMQLILSSAALAACYAITGVTQSRSIYSVVICLFGVAMCLFIPNLMRFCSAVDHSGRVARLVNGALPLATALGPFLATRMLSVLSYSAIGCITAALTLGAAAVIGFMRVDASLPHVSA
jgi:predicted MFS family arabinose efflux permease